MVKNLSLIISEAFDDFFIENIFKKLSSTGLTDIIIIFDYSLCQDWNKLISEITKELRVTNIILFNSNLSKIDYIENVNIIYLKEGYENLNIRKINFNFNIEYLSEAKYFNPFFFKKIYINKNGLVFNYFGQKHNFGNIKNNKLEEIIKDENFLILWNTSKNKITGCRNCEYRLVCYDSSVPVKNKKEWILDNECDYNPFIAKWKN